MAQVAALSDIFCPIANRDVGVASANSRTIDTHAARTVVAAWSGGTASALRPTLDTVVSALAKTAVVACPEANCAVRVARAKAA